MIPATYSRSSELTRPRVTSYPSAHLPLLRNDIETFFDAFLRRNAWPLQDGPASLVPPVNVSESSSGYRVTADLPGLRREDLTVSAEGDSLVISGSRSEESSEDGRNFICRECACGEFRRSISFAEDADLARASATMSNGQLTIDVPRSQGAASRRRVIPVGDVSGSPSSSSSSSRSGSSRSL